MKITVFRSIMFACLAMMAGVFSITVSTPASASEFAVYSIDHAPFDVVLFEPAGLVASEKERLAPTPAIAELRPMPPAYHLSWRTAGQSLSPHHLRL